MRCDLHLRICNFIDFDDSTRQPAATLRVASFWRFANSAVALGF